MRCLRALSIRQPYAELILRGIKTAELRSRATSIVGERFYIYASEGKSEIRIPKSETKPKSEAQIIGDNIAVPGDGLPPWMIELAEQVKMIEPGAILPTGVIVGSAVIERVTILEPLDPLTPSDDSSRRVRGGERVSVGSSEPAMYVWHLVDVQRAKTFRKPTRHPQPVWFRPF